MPPAQGQVVDLSILEPIMTAVGPGPTIYQQLQHVEPRHGNRSTNNAPRNIYPTADGSWVAVSTSAQRIAERVLELVGHPEVVAEPWFSTGAGRAEHVDLLDAHVGGWIASRSRAEVRRGVREGRRRDRTRVRRCGPDQRPARPRDGDAARGAGRRARALLQHNVMWRMSESPGEIRFTGRALGADTDAVLAEARLLAGGDHHELRQSEAVR